MYLYTVFSMYLFLKSHNRIAVNEAGQNTSHCVSQLSMVQVNKANTVFMFILAPLTTQKKAFKCNIIQNKKYIIGPNYCHS